MKKNKHLLSSILLVVVLLLNPIFADANPLEELNSERLAISLVIDTSGSMITTDPQMFREEVANTFIELLYPDDYLGIITFNSKVDLTIPMTKMSDDAIRNTMKTGLTGRLGGAGDTDYKAALEMANTQLNELNDPEARKLIIFLTDGKPDPNPVNITSNPQQMTNYMESLWGIVSNISGNGYPVYSIGFSDGIDIEILNRIASETNGDVRIFTDSADLDENLIQVLQSRESLVEELLAPAIIQSSEFKPVLSTEFWPKVGGYRTGEQDIVVVSLLIANQKVSEGVYLEVDTLILEVKKDDGNVITLELFDNGDPANNDVLAGDGKWSNRLVLDEKYKAKANLIAEGRYRGEAFKLNKSLGELFVEEPGNILISNTKDKLWVKRGNQLLIPLRFENKSLFKEVISVSVDRNIGTVANSQLELEPDSDKHINIIINLKEGTNTGIYDTQLLIKPLHNRTTVEGSPVSIEFEVVSFFGGIVNKANENLILLSALFGVFILLPLFIYLIGILLYKIFVAPAFKVSGKLIYWKEGHEENKAKFDLTQKKKNRVIISFFNDKNSDFNIDGSSFQYNLVIEKKKLVDNPKFIMGWKSILSKKLFSLTIIYCTQPGIIEYKGEISTGLNINDGMEFSSGSFVFRYEMDKIKLLRGDDAGRNILEGRTNDL